MGQGLLAGPAGEMLGFGVGVGGGVVVVWFDDLHDIPNVNEPKRSNTRRAFTERIRMMPP